MPAYLFILVMLAVVWVFLIRPRQRKMREQQRQVAALQAGDEIITAGGLHGTVRALEDSTLKLEIAPGVVTTLDRRAVAAVARDVEVETGVVENLDEDPPEPG